MTPTPLGRPAWKKAVLFGASFLIEKDSAGSLVLSGGRVTVVALTAIWGVAVIRSPELLATWPTAWLGGLLAFALRVHVDLEVLKPGAAMGLMDKLISRSGRGTGVALAGRESPAAQPWDSVDAESGPEGLEPVDTDARFYGEPFRPERPELATGEPIPSPAPPEATTKDARAPEVTAPVAVRRDLDALDRLLSTNGVSRFGAAELAKPGKVSGRINNGMPPREMWNNIVPTAIVLQWLRDRTGRAVTVVSGYRSDRYNQAVGGARDSLHRLFNAADVNVQGMKPDEVAAMLEQHPEARNFGIGVYQTFVHIDTRGHLGRAAPARWRG
jgi:hypothetical protein